MTTLSAVLIVLAVELLVGGGIGLYWLGKHDRKPVEGGPSEVDATEEISLRPDPDPDHAPTASWMRGLVMETVIVHTTTGLSYEGLLVLEHEKGLILRNPMLLDDQRSPTPMAGELWLSREKIEAVQTKPVELTNLPAAS